MFYPNATEKPASQLLCPLADKNDTQVTIYLPSWFSTEAAAKVRAMIEAQRKSRALVMVLPKVVYRED